MRARNSVLIVGWKRSASGLPIASSAVPDGLPFADFDAERHERGRADLDRAGAEQVVALAVADLAAARPAGLEQRLEHLQLGRARLAGCAGGGC